MDRTDLFTYQRKAVELVISEKRLALFITPGLGKTAIALYAFRLVNKRPGLIVAPINVCNTVWQQEAKEWRELRELTFVNLVGKNPRQRKELLNNSPDLFIINYELLHWLVKERNDFEFVIFDELSKLKSPTAKVSKASRKIKAEYRLGLTGTPRGNSMLGMWSQIEAITPSNNPLGRNVTQFRSRFFYQKPWVTYPSYEPYSDTESRITREIRNIAFSFSPNKETVEVKHLFIRTGELPSKAQNLIDKLRENLYLELQSGNSLSAPNAAALMGKIRQIETGQVYTDKGCDIIHSLKVDATRSLLEELQGDPIIIFHEYIHERERLLKELKDWRIETSINDKTLTEFREGNIPVLLLHPKSAGHGLNLQTCSNMLFYSLPWSLELFTQAKGRIIRTGQKSVAKLYFFKGLVIEDTIRKALINHKSLEDALMEALNVTKLKNSAL